MAHSSCLRNAGSSVDEESLPLASDSDAVCKARIPLPKHESGQHGACRGSSVADAVSIPAAFAITVPGTGGECIAVLFPGRLAKLRADPAVSRQRCKKKRLHAFHGRLCEQ